MWLKERSYNPPRFDIDQTEGFRRRHYMGNVDDEAIEKSIAVTSLTIEAFSNRNEAIHFQKYVFSWEGYCFQRKILEEVHAEGGSMSETIFIGGKRVAYLYLQKIIFQKINKSQLLY